MEIKIERAWTGDLEKYKEVLERFKPVYKQEGQDHYALLEVKDLNDLFQIANELETDLIIRHYKENRVTIYDDYVE